MVIRGYAETFAEGAVLFQPTGNGVVAVGSLVTWNWRLGSAWEGVGDHGRRDEALVVIERFTVAGADRYILVPREVAKQPRPSSPENRNRRRGFRVDVAPHSVEATFVPAYGAPPAKGTIKDISFGGAALVVPGAIEEVATRTIELDAGLSLFPRQAPTRLRTTIKNRRLEGESVVWGLAFRFAASPEPIRAEGSIRDYLIAEQLDAMRKRARKQPKKATRPVFYIPTRSPYWEPSRSADPTRSMGTEAWTLLEAKRTRAVATRLFPDVDFEIAEEVPASQTYEKGSVNLEIKAVLEKRTALRLQRKRSR